METFGKRLQHFIDTAYPKNFKGFVEKVGAEATTIYRYLSGEREPKASILADIEQLSGCSASWLLTGNGDMFANNAIGKELRKKHVGKDLPQTVEEVLGADTKEALRRALSEVMERFTG